MCGRYKDHPGAHLLKLQLTRGNYSNWCNSMCVCYHANCNIPTGTYSSHKTTDVRMLGLIFIGCCRRHLSLIFVSSFIVYFLHKTKFRVYGAKSATADSCFGLIGSRQCSAALGGPATSKVDLRHQGAFNKLKHVCMDDLWKSIYDLSVGATPFTSFCLPGPPTFQRATLKNW